MENLIRQIREAAGMNQSDFARAIGRSTQMLRLYERYQVPRPPEVVEKLKSIAAEAGRGDLAGALSGDGRNAPPAETLAPISAHERRRLHTTLDEILDSGDEDALSAVIPNLDLFRKWVRQVKARKK